MNLLQTWFANCCESYRVKFPLLYLAFFKTILAALFRTFGLLISCLQKPSFFDDHFTTQHLEFFQFFSSFFN